MKFLVRLNPQVNRYAVHSNRHELLQISPKRTVGQRTASRRNEVVKSSLMLSYRQHASMFLSLLPRQTLPLSFRKI